MSIRLDPRRVNALKHLAGEAGMRPGDLVRQWVEERIDSARVGADVPTGTGESLMSRIDELVTRITVLETAAGIAAPEPAAKPEPTPTREPTPTPTDEQSQPPKRARSTVAAAPAGERVALHDEMIAVLTERGPMSAAELAGAVTERGRYAPPRSGKPINAAMVSQRVSNPTYRARFVRNEGRISLAE